jgi:hypothetical protein
MFFRFGGDGVSRFFQLLPGFFAACSDEEYREDEK